LLKLYIDMIYLIISIVIFFLFYNTVLKRIFISNKQENSIKRNLADSSIQNAEIVLNKVTFIKMDLKVIPNRLNTIIK
jgi:hypothetical protein